VHTMDGADPGLTKRMELQQAVSKAKSAVRTASNAMRRSDVAAARAALANVQKLTIELGTITGSSPAGTSTVPKTGDPFAHLAIKTHPKSPHNNYPALGLKMNVKTADKLGAPVSNTLSSWGMRVSKKAQALADSAKKEDKATFKKFGLLEKILSPKGNGKGFGKVHIGAKNQLPPPGLRKEIRSAHKILKKSTRTLNHIQKAIKEQTKSKRKDEKSKRKYNVAMSKADAADRKKMARAAQATLTRIQTMDDAFRQKHHLLQYSKDGHAKIQHRSKPLLETPLTLKGTARSTEVVVKKKVGLTMQANRANRKETRKQLDQVAAKTKRRISKVPSASSAQADARSRIQAKGQFKKALKAVRKQSQLNAKRTMTNAKPSQASRQNEKNSRRGKGNEGRGDAEKGRGEGSEGRGDAEKGRGGVKQAKGQPRSQLNAKRTMTNAKHSQASRQNEKKNREGELMENLQDKKFESHFRDQVKTVREGITKRNSFSQWLAKMPSH